MIGLLLSFLFFPFLHREELGMGLLSSLLNSNMNFTLFTLSLFTLITAWLLDLFFGDPAWLPHPVVGFGRWISFWEHKLNHGAHRRAKGACLAVGSILLVGFLIWLLLHKLLLSEWPQDSTSLALWRGVGGVAVSILLIFFCLAGHTLRREVRDVFRAVDQSLDAGRRQVARIVGRDTSSLSTQEVRTAALETLAENLSDGVVAPLFWFALLGVPGMMAYKMVNTLDSMIGYRSERYRDFGCWAARIDDLANYIPARLTAALILLSHRLLFTFRLLERRIGSRGWSFVRQYGPQHLSPNSGWPEAALAACLDCRFGGTHDYFGKAVPKPYIGDNPRELTTADLHTSLRLCFMAELFALILSLLSCCFV